MIDGDDGLAGTGKKPSVGDPSGGEDREGFEKEYRAWTLAMAKEAAQRLSTLSSGRRDRALETYRRYRDPHAVFSAPSDPARISRLSGERARSFVLVETEAVTFFPSIYSAVPGALDFAVAMNRRFYYRGLWFPIISLNSEYISRSRDKILAFTLEHEFEMSRIFQEIATNLRPISQGEKRAVGEEAQGISAERLQITPEELIEDEKLMTELSLTSVLIPKPYAELALLSYVEDHFDELKDLGVASISPEEEAFGRELLDEFTGWSSFSKETYDLFAREVGSALRDAYHGYG